jgi:hypothetical protein
MNEEDSLRLYYDWWGQCRTCRFWSATEADRLAMRPSKCLSFASPLSGQETWTEGHCLEWDAFDLDRAIAFLELIERH